MPDYSLIMKSSIFPGTSVYKHNLTDLAPGWRRSLAWKGGPWLGTFRVYHDRDFLDDIFYQGVGAHIEEKVHANLTWDGFIWEVDYVTFDELQWTRKGTRGKRLRRTYDDMFNRVKVVYTDPSTSIAGETSWHNDAISQNLYGIKEEVLYREIDSTGATEMAQEFLQLHSSMAPKIAGLEEKVEQPFVEVTVVGYVALAQFRYSTTPDQSASTVGAWVEDIFDTDLQFLNKGILASNTTNIDKYVSEKMRAWALLEELLTLRGPADERYRIHVLPGRTIRYEEWNPEPIGLFYNSRLSSRNYVDLESDPRLVQPGIYRDVGSMPAFGAYPQVSSDPFFLMPVDFLLDTIEVNQKGLLVPRLGLYEDEEAWRTFEIHEEAGAASDSAAPPDPYDIGDIWHLITPYMDDPPDSPPPAPGPPGPGTP